MTDYFSGKCPLFDTGLTPSYYLKINSAGTQIESDITAADATTNATLLELKKNHYGATAPSTTYAGMWWVDTTTNLLKQRDTTNASWITIGSYGTAYLALLSLGTAQTITAQHTFSPGSAQAPFILGANAQNQKVTGLYADTAASATGAETSLAGQSANLVCIPHASTPKTHVTVTADSFVVATSGGITFKIPNVNFTVDLTSSGVINGLDTGSEGNYWYHLWVAYNPTSGLHGGLFSRSTSAPSLPSGYTYYGYVGAWNNTSGDLVSQHQKGNRVMVVPITAVSGGAETSATAINGSNIWPSNARILHGYVWLNGNTADTSYNINLYATTTEFGKVVIGSDSISTYGVYDMQLVNSPATGLYYDLDIGGGTLATNVYVTGWTY